MVALPDGHRIRGYHRKSLAVDEDDDMNNIAVKEAVKEALAEAIKPLHADVQATRSAAETAAKSAEAAAKSAEAAAKSADTAAKSAEAAAKSAETAVKAAKAAEEEAVAAKEAASEARRESVNGTRWTIGVVIALFVLMGGLGSWGLSANIRASVAEAVAPLLREVAKQSENIRWIENTFIADNPN